MPGIPVRVLDPGTAGQGLVSGPEGYPIWADDAATTAIKSTVRMASTTNLVATRVSSTLTADANGALGTIDGVTPVVGDRVLLKDQTTGADKGIYVINDLGGAGKWVMTRATDFDSAEDVRGGLLVPISEGSIAGNTVYQLTTSDPITLNTTALTFGALAAASPIGVRTLQLTPASFVAGQGTGANTNGTPRRYSLGAALPAGAVVIGHILRGVTATNAVTSLSAAVGCITPVDDFDTMVTADDMQAAASYRAGTLGDAPDSSTAAGQAVYGGAQMTVTVTPDGGEKVSAVTVGEWHATVWFMDGTGL